MLDQLEADAVICTIPYGVLRHIAVTPEWPTEKRRVIDSLYYGPVERIIFQVSDRYWEREGLNGFGVCDKGFEVWAPTFGSSGKRGLLQSYVFEQYAAELDGLTESERVQRVIADMDEVHPGLRRYLETTIIKSWSNDPWQRGAFVVYRAGQQKWYAEICRRVGKVWFAGEHASGWPGWMQGALTSGIKAAKEVACAQAPFG
jgi:monoamine oxidase